jgi:hypothetical protein
MKSGDLALAPRDELMPLERVPSDPAEVAAYDDEFRVQQQQKIQRLSEYYDQVVAELLALLNESHDEGDLAPPISVGEAQ